MAAKKGRRIIPLTMAIEDPEQDRQPTDAVEHREVTMIRRYRDLPEALLAKTSLESAGVACFLADDNIVRMDWFWSNLLGGVKLFVHTEDADAAVKILEETAPDAFELAARRTSARAARNAIPWTSILRSSHLLHTSAPIWAYRSRSTATDGDVTHAATSGKSNRAQMPD